MKTQTYHITLVEQRQTIVWPLVLSMLLAGFPPLFINMKIAFKIANNDCNSFMHAFHIL